MNTIYKCTIRSAFVKTALAIQYVLPDYSASCKIVTVAANHVTRQRKKTMPPKNGEAAQFQSGLIVLRCVWHSQRPLPGCATATVKSIRNSKAAVVRPARRNKSEIGYTPREATEIRSTEMSGATNCYSCSKRSIPVAVSSP
jgi:hypothetical protein